MPDEDIRFMERALRQAHLAIERGGGEVGWVIARNGEVIAEGYNEGELRNDPTAHAEMVTLRRAGERLQSIDFSGCVLYCTLQPCACARWLACGRRSVASCMASRGMHDRLHPGRRKDIQVTAGVMADECSRLYQKP